MTSMNIGNDARRLGIVCGLLAVALFAAGCRTSPAQPGDAGAGASAPQATADAGTPSAAAPNAAKSTSDLLRIGDSVNVTLLDLPQPQAPMDVTIKEDGTITLPLLTQHIKAEGKTTGQLEKDIWQSYVPSYYKHMTVVVKAQGQYYSVKGEVKSPNRYAYNGATTVLKAITAAGDFTDFARKSTVKVFRSDGRIETEDCRKALKKPSLDLPVYPGDLINVERRTSPFQK